MKYCPHMISKFDYGKIDNILIASLYYTYNIYSDHCLAHVAVNMVANSILIISCFQIAVFRIRILLNSM